MKEILFKKKEEQLKSTIPFLKTKLQQQSVCAVYKSAKNVKELEKERNNPSAFI